MGHQIDGIYLVSKKASKQRFRASIFSAWNHKCAYCGEHATTIDHVKAKARGGGTTRRNCVPACLRCNADKSHAFVWRWWIKQPFWNLFRAHKLLCWVKQIDLPSYAQCKSEPATDHWHSGQ